ncbi:LysR family transcriptional regulator [Brucella anthropi]|uniref:LysR family transcriptional regulator n=1 Tax=Brucella anthropi TaxID=529 RepID=UPI00384B2F6E
MVVHRISVRKLAAFVASVDCGSFTEGARRMNISQPAAVSMIKDMEMMVGAELFVRSGKVRSTKLTERGEEVYNTIINALSVYDAAMADIADNKPRVQRIFIQSPYVNNITLLWIEALFAKYKGRRLSIQSADWAQIVAEFQNKSSSIALIDGDVQCSSMHYHSLGVVEFVLVVPESSPCYQTAGDVISWSDVPKETIIYSGVNPRAVGQIYRNLHGGVAERSRYTEIGCAIILRKLIERNGNAAIIPNVLSSLICASRKSRIMHFEKPKIFTPIGLVVPLSHRFDINFEQVIM